MMQYPAALDLVRWFGQVPSFHDAEILSLQRSAPAWMDQHK
jgi:hypothetical protein